MKFRYVATDCNDKIIKGEIEAIDINDAIEKLKPLNFALKQIDIVKNDKYSVVKRNTDNQIQYPTIRFINLQDKILFTSELQTLLASGISLIEAIAVIQKNSPSRKIKYVCATVQNALKQGKTLYNTLTLNYKEAFGEFYLSLVKAGEDSGELETVLSRLLSLLKRQQKTKSKVISSLIYPGILLSLMFLLGIVFTVVIFPQFLKMYEDMGITLPFLANTLYSFCKFVGHYFIVLILLFAFSIYIFVSALKNTAFKTSFDTFILKLPVFSTYSIFYSYSNFLAVLYIAYESGVSMINSVELSVKSISNLVLKQQFSPVIRQLNRGVSLSDSLSGISSMPDEITSMISAGENSGSLGKMLNNALNYAEEKLDAILDTITKMFEPAMLIILGAAVLVIVLAFVQLYLQMMTGLL